MSSVLKHISNSVVRQLGDRKVARHFDRGPIVIGGCGRSGTTLLLSILAAHPEIFAIPHESVSLVKWEPQPGRGAESPFRPARIDRLYRYILPRRIPKGQHIWAEKTPRNVRHIEQILNYWHDALFIHIIRDPRDVLTSRHQNRPGEYWVSRKRWVNDVTKGLAFQDHPRVYTLRYEDLVQHFEPTIRRLCDFLKLECVPEILDWHTHTTVRRNRSWKGKVVKLHAKSVRKWEKPEHHERLSQILSDERITDLMERLSYN